MSDNNRKLIEMEQKIDDNYEDGKQTNENFETNEPLNANHSRHGSHFNLLDTVNLKSEEKMGNDLVQKVKEKLPQKKAGQKPERPTADVHPMHRLTGDTLTDDEIQAEGQSAK